MNDRILKFKGTWRNYQARVLERADSYFSDGKIHIVAAPGSGKTTLGIELVGRIAKPTLILAPSVTIRQQWQERIIDAFLVEGIEPETVISQNLKEPKLITIATYQALHSAMTRYKGTLSEDQQESDETLPTEDVDFTGFDVVATMKKQGVEVLCLDECHHLRSEWWKALEDFKDSMGNMKIIALTATPPYDSTPAMWERYMSMCGEIDEEITVPELVKEGSLCPHQDFVYLNYPTEDETAVVDQFLDNVDQAIEYLMADPSFEDAVKNHDFLRGTRTEEEMLEEPAYLSAILIFLNEKNIMFPQRLKSILGARHLPKMDPKWMQLLLQKMLYDDSESFYMNEEYKEAILDYLKQLKLVEKRKVTLERSLAINKLLISSKGKCQSIIDIARTEYANMGQGLRMLVLTDYIRKEWEKKLGSPEEFMPTLGVLPFFEMLRKQFAAGGPRLAVLCGSIVIIPAEAKEALIAEIGDAGEVNFSSVGELAENDYIKVNAVGDAHFLTGAVTALFSKGYMQIVIGTKSLLGEGWDSPCINSLILASFVGSFMLSNQMRGRAIRVFKEDPNKTSNIWHLVCIKPESIKRQERLEGVVSANDYGEDLELLERRMEHFLGLHYRENFIENGMDRLEFIQPPFDKSSVEKMNGYTLDLAARRELLASRWKSSLEIKKQIEVIEETSVKDNMVTAALFYDYIRDIILGVLCAIILRTLGRLATIGPVTTVLTVMAFVAFFYVIYKYLKAMTLGSPFRRLKKIGTAILGCLREQNLLEEPNCRVEAESAGPQNHATYLVGGTARDKSLYAQSLVEFFGVVDNQRYLLVKSGRKVGKYTYYCVPEAFAKNKAMAEAFAKSVSKVIGKYDLVYTRSEAGRKVLLAGRKFAYANINEKCYTRKKVKGALE